jgi:GNAT superfamily N-acetyltransferase
VVGQLRGSPPAQRMAHAQRLALSPVPYQGWVLRQPDNGPVLACGQSAAEGDLVGLYDVFTHPQVRGQGLARLLCSRLLAQAHAAGARVAYLQVDADNDPARAIYRRLGFADAYAYHYRSPDPTTDAHGAHTCRLGDATPLVRTCAMPPVPRRAAGRRRDGGPWSAASTRRR